MSTNPGRCETLAGMLKAERPLKHLMIGQQLSHLAKLAKEAGATR